MKQNVYHSSYTSDIKTLEPVSAVHGVPYLYAAKDPVISVVFMTNKKNNNGDLSYWKGRNPETGKVAIVERYSGAFRDLYDGVSGSVYTLSGDTFVEGKTRWSEEVVSEAQVLVLEETKITNIFDYLKSLEKESRLEIYEYPLRPECVPVNDKDLIVHAFRYGRMDVIEKLHPKLFKKIQDFLESV